MGGIRKYRRTVAKSRGDRIPKRSWISRLILSVLQEDKRKKRKRLNRIASESRRRNRGVEMILLLTAAVLFSSVIISITTRRGGYVPHSPPPQSFIYFTVNTGEFEKAVQQACDVMAEYANPTAADKVVSRQVPPPSTTERNRQRFEEWLAQREVHSLIKDIEGVEL